MPMSIRPKEGMPPGALPMLILRVLQSNSLHGYAIAQRIHLLSSEVLAVEEGLLYPTLQKMLIKGWVTAEWGISETNRKVRFYRLQPRPRAVESRTLRLRSRHPGHPGHSAHRIGDFPMGELWRRISYLVNHRRLDAELEADMEFHREMATRAGRNNFGNTLRMREQSREAWGWTWLDRLVARPSLRHPHTRPRSWIHSDGRAHSRHRHRRQCRGLQCFQHGRSQASPCPRSFEDCPARASLARPVHQRDSVPILPLLSATRANLVCRDSRPRRPSHADRR